MRICRSLARLERSCNKRIRRLIKHAHDVRGLRATASGVEERRAAEHLAGAIVIDALNTWSNFAREYYVSCMLGACTASGVLVQMNLPVAGHNQAIGAAMVRLRPWAKPKSDGSWNRRDEPAWHDPITLINLSRAYAFSNQIDVRAAFSGSQSKTFSDLPKVRNFFAHRNWQTCDGVLRIAASYGIAPVRVPSDLLFGYATGDVDTLIRVWLADIELVISYLCC